MANYNEVPATANVVPVLDDKAAQANADKLAEANIAEAIAAEEQANDGTLPAGE